jgi:hypothetical protein
LGGIKAGGKEIKNVADANPHAANAGAFAALRRIDGDSVQ